MKKILFLVAAISLCSACATNPYREYYKGPKEWLDIAKTIPEKDPQLINGNDLEKDMIMMLEDSYVLMGWSEFNAAEANIKDALSFGKDLRADTVVASNKYTHTLSGVNAVFLPDTQTSQTLIHGNTYGPNGFNNFNGIANTTTHGTKTAYVPYSVDRSNYSATFWRKVYYEKFGVRALDLTTEQRKSIGSNKGVFVFAVVKKSPAFHAGIMRGDILLKIGNTEVIDTESLNEIVQQMGGKLLIVEFIRDNKLLKAMSLIGK